MTALLGFIAVLAIIVFGVSMLVVSVQVFRRRPARRWGIMAIISFLVLIAVGIASPNNNTGPAKPGTTTPESGTTARTEETTAQKTNARPQVANTTTNSGTTKGETTAAQTTAVTTSSSRYIPGLSGSGLQAQLESRGFTCTFSRDVAPADPQGKGPIGSEYDCTSGASGGGNTAGSVDVTIHNYSGDNVDEIAGTVYGPNTDSLSQLATTNYSDAQPEQAQEWVNDNVGLVAFQAPRSTQFGSVKFELSGNPPNAYTLDISAPRRGIGYGWPLFTSG